MSFPQVDLKRVILLVLLTLFLQDVQAQKRTSSSIKAIAERPSQSPEHTSVDRILHEPFAVDTLRNYDINDPNRFAFLSDSLFSQGWVHGTNRHEDIAKATKLTLPDGMTSAILNEVLVLFIYKAPTVTTETYDIEIREVALDGAPSALIASQTYNLNDIQADDDFNTAAIPTSHVFSEGVQVPRQFFVVVNFGSYSPAQYENVSIGASDNLGRLVEEDWELLSGGTWINISRSWFTNDPENNGWHMIIDAVVNTTQVDASEPDNSASQATPVSDGFVATGATIFPVGDVDYYSFPGDVGDEVEIIARADAGSQLDGALVLYNSAGALVASNDDFNGNTAESRINVTLTAPDTYFIRYSAFDNDTGSDFPNKREVEESEESPSPLESRAAIELLGIPADPYGSKSNQDIVEPRKPGINRVNNTGEYTLELNITVNQTADVTPPEIQHTPVSVLVPEGQDVVVQAEVTDPGGTGVSFVNILYVPGGTNSGNSVQMRLVSGNTYEGIIPGSAINERSVQYVLFSDDFANNRGISQTVNLEVRFDQGFNIGIPVSGTDENSYRLLSMPVNLDNSTVRGVIEDDLGVYDPEVWRFWELGVDQEYSEFPNVGGLTPGRAYWLAASEAGQSINTGPATSVPTTFFIDIPLNPGWTFFSTPFNFPTQPSQFEVLSGVVPDIRAFNGSWQSFSGALMPFQGYAIASATADQLRFNPFIPDEGAGKTNEPHSVESTYDWAISIAASSGEILDDDNVLGVSGEALQGYDLYDRPEPPVIGQYISLYFPHRDWDVPFSHFNVDVRPVFDEVQEWSFEVSTNVDEPVVLSFDGLDSLPEEFDIHLVDKQMHYMQDLRASSVYTIRGRQEDVKERFSIVVGRADLVAEEVNERARIPESLSLQTYPNPFHTYMTLEYGLPDASTVSIEVYDILGKRVHTLMNNEAKSEGTYAIQWDGTDAAGRPLANGIYVFSVQSGSTKMTKKVVLVR